MSRNKSMTKSRWKLNDKTFRDEQNARAAANRARKALNAEREAALAAGLPWPPVDDEAVAE